MKLFLARHCEAEAGEQLDPTRGLTLTGEAQIKVMARFLATQTSDIGAVLCSSDLKRGIDTGEGLAKRLDVPVLYSPWVDPGVDIRKCWHVIQKAAAGLEDGKELLVVSHGPTVNSLAAMLLDSGEGDKFHFSHGAIMHLDTEEPAIVTGYPDAGRGNNPAYLHWFASVKMMNRAMELDPDAIIAEAIRIADEILREEGHDVSDEERDDHGRWAGGGSGGGSEKETVSFKPSGKMERSMASMVKCGQKEQKIADEQERIISKAIGVPRTADNSAFDNRNAKVGVEIKTMLSSKNGKITMSKAALERKITEAKRDKLKTFTVVADKRSGKTQYYVKAGVGSFRVGSMTPSTLSEIKAMVRK